MHEISKNDNFTYLAISLVLLLAGIALAQQFFDQAAQRFLQSFAVVTLLISVWGVENKRKIIRREIFLPLSIIAASLLSNISIEFEHNYVHLFLLLIFFIWTAITTARQVLFTGSVDGNKILGAICLYILLGLIYAMTYTLIHVFSNEAFNGIEPLTDWYSVLPDFIYFSFVTITTLGFGDISPGLPITRFLVYLEAIVGQFYLAILVASLVGSRLSTPQINIEVKDEK